MENNPNLADLVCEYVNERLPQYQFSLEQGSTIYHHIGATALSYAGIRTWHVGMTHEGKFCMLLNNGKFIWLDVFCEGSLDVIYRLIRLNIAKRTKEHHYFIQHSLSMKNRKEYIAWRRTTYD
jgi:hypothetical protein